MNIKEDIHESAKWLSAIANMSIKNADSKKNIILSFYGGLLTMMDILLEEKIIEVEELMGIERIKTLLVSLKEAVDESKKIISEIKGDE